MATKVLIFSQVLSCFFVGSVTFWYMLTPYLVKPHPDIMDAILTKSKLTRPHPSPSPSSSANTLLIENWTKWRLFVNSTAAKEQDKVVYGHTAASVDFRGKAMMNLEFRPEYKVEVDTASSSQSSPSTLSVARTAPPYSASEWGIYNHFEATAPSVGNDKGKSKNVVRVVPRFLFGLAREAVEEMYGPDVDNYPIIGIFTSSTKYDRIIIQAYMNIVTLSVIFLLWANNPPAAIIGSLQKKKTS